MSASIRITRKSLNNSLVLHGLGKGLILDLNSGIESSIGENGHVVIDPKNKKWILTIFSTGETVQEKVRNAHKIHGKGFSNLWDSLIRIPYTWENDKEFDPESKTKVLKDRFTALTSI